MPELRLLVQGYVIYTPVPWLAVACSETCIVLFIAGAPVLVACNMS